MGSIFTYWILVLFVGTTSVSTVELITREDCEVAIVNIIVQAEKKGLDVNNIVGVCIPKSASHRG